MNPEGTPEPGAMSKKSGGTADADIIAEVKTRFAQCHNADSENHINGLDDLRFLKGDQWPEKQKRARESEGRPVLTINKLPTFLQQITNDQRQNRIGIKVSPVSERADSKTAELIQGMIRHIEYDSAADVATDTAVNSAAAIGFGYYRLVTEYESPDSFDQKIMFKRIRNPFTVSADPSSVEPDGSDCEFYIISEKMRKDLFMIEYPNAELTCQGFDTPSVGDNDSRLWMEEATVRVAEYYRFEYEPKTLYQLSDGTTSWDRTTLPEGVTVLAERKSAEKKLMWYKLTPYEVLERAEIKCKWIPVFPVYGSEIDVDGKVYRSGVIRNAKDPAMMYNFWMTSATEEVSLRPKTPYIGAAGQFEGQEKRWAQANNRSFAYLEYNPVSMDGQLAPPPSRQPMVDVPVGVLTMANHASDNIKATTGLFDSSLGAQGNATSGKQEIAQQKQGNVANFHYSDNLRRTHRHCGRCIIDMIPHYYDTERLIRTRGENDDIKGETINKWDDVANKFLNDVRVGEYDVAVTSGPSYSTMRAEAGDAMVQFGQSWPKLMDVAGDLVVKAMNWPGNEEIAERIGRIIPANIKADDDGTKPPIPPEVQQKLQDMEKEVQELQKDADTNHANVTREQIKKEAAIEVAQIQATSRSDVEEIKGYIKLLVEKMQPPPVVENEAQKNFAKSPGDYQENEETSGAGMNASPESAQGVDGPAEV